MNKGVLYGVGVGPGDKELLTVKAVNILKSVDVIAVPFSGNGEKTAFNIVSEYVGGKEITECFLPMIKDRKKLDEYYDSAANNIEGYLKKGRNIAFITLGDVSVYSTYMRIDKRIAERGYKTIMIPGVTSFSAAAARLNISLCEGNETLSIIPASAVNSDNISAEGCTKVIMKPGKSIEKIKDLLKKHELYEKSCMIERCGMENEHICSNLDDVDENASYFSIIIVKG